MTAILPYTCLKQTGFLCHADTLQCSSGFIRLNGAYAVMSYHLNFDSRIL